MKSLVNVQHAWPGRYGRAGRPGRGDLAAAVLGTGGIGRHAHAGRPSLRTRGDSCNTGAAST